MVADVSEREASFKVEQRFYDKQGGIIIIKTKEDLNGASSTPTNIFIPVRE